MKTISKWTIFGIVILLMTNCSKKDSSNNSGVQTQNCTAISSSVDTVLLGTQKICFVTSISSNTPTTSLVEIVNEGDSSLVNVTIELLQIQLGTNCWETTLFTEMIPPNTNTRAFKSDNVPTWAYNQTATAYIKIKKFTKDHYIRDKWVNK